MNEPSDIAASTIFLQLAVFLPRLVTAFLIVLIGGFVARHLGRWLAALVTRVGLDKLAQENGLTDILQKCGIRRTPAELLGMFGFWLLLALVIAAAADMLYLPAITTAARIAMAYLPKLLAATLIIVVGASLAVLARGVVRSALSGFDIPLSSAAAAACHAFIILAAVLAALDLLELRFAFFNEALLIILAGMALALGLSLGLGGRELAAGLLAGWYVRRALQAGDHVQVAGQEGTVREVGAWATVIEAEDEQGVIRRRSIPNTKMLLDAIR